MDNNFPVIPAEQDILNHPVSEYPQLLPSYEIVVNGRTCLVRTDHIDHAQLVKLAFPLVTDVCGNTSTMTVSFRDGPQSAACGILAPLERTPLANRETFIVVRTDKS